MGLEAREIHQDTFLIGVMGLGAREIHRATSFEEN